MNSLGFSTSQLVMYAIVSNTVILLIEIPAGILADRWSRKGVLLSAVVCMSIGCVLLGLAGSFLSFMVATAFTGLFFGMSSGVQEAMVYDTVLESKKRHQYEKTVGRLRLVLTVGLVISSTLGAVVASKVSFQLPFYMSVVSCAVGFIFLAFFKEPRLHREVETVRLVSHIKNLVMFLAQHPEIRLLALTNVLIGIMFCFMLEIDPLWPIALGLATIWYGPLNALMMFGYGFGGFLAGIARSRLRFVRLLGIGTLLAALGLTIESIYLVILSLFVLVTCTAALMVVLSGRIQDRLPSSQRSGSESAISTVSRLSFVAVLPLFTSIAQSKSVFAAAWILVFVGVFVLVGMRRSFRIARPTVSL